MCQTAEPAAATTLPVPTQVATLDPETPHLSSPGLTEIGRSRRRTSEERAQDLTRTSGAAKSTAMPPPTSPAACADGYLDEDLDEEPEI
jgi:hypothetical protein